MTARSSRLRGSALRRGGALALSVLVLPVLGADLHVDRAWIREMPPVADRSAAYMRIENRATEDRVLQAVECETFDRVEIHQTVHDGGTMRMRPVNALRVPARGSVALEPGGYHIMLMSRRGPPLASGDRVVLHLVFDDGAALDVSAEVARQAPE